MLCVKTATKIPIKNTCYSSIYLTCILFCFNKLNLKFFQFFYFLKNGVHGLFSGAGIRENTVGNKKKILNVYLHVKKNSNDNTMDNLKIMKALH
jgi:hypothetical protein